jgi:hypothetical protein
MIPKGLFAQIGMVILSAGIIMTHIKPALDDIRVAQDDVIKYQEELATVSGVNNRLRNLSEDINSISTDSREKLLTYLPDAVDELSVARDLKLMTEEAGLIFLGVEYQDDQPVTSSRQRRSSSQTPEDPNLPKTMEFSISVEGSYTDLKQLLLLLPQNHYPLELHTLEVDKIDLNLLRATLSLVTYAYNPDTLNDN